MSSVLVLFVLLSAGYAGELQEHLGLGEASTYVSSDDGAKWKAASKSGQEPDEPGKRWNVYSTPTFSSSAAKEVRGHGGNIFSTIGFALWDLVSKNEVTTNASNRLIHVLPEDITLTFPLKTEPFST